jgi:hypothetical protein
MLRTVLTLTSMRDVMASERQIAANRRNAQSSTGPKTKDGKAASRRNALTHGLTANKLMLEGEDPDVFKALRDELFNEFKPGSAYEEQLTEHMVAVLWRLRRVPVFEAALLSWMAYRQEERHDSEYRWNENPPVDYLDYGRHLGFGPFNEQLEVRPRNGRLAPDTRARLKLGRLLEAEINKNLTAKLGRYEAQLFRQLKQTRQELEEVKAARIGAKPAEAAALLAPPTTQPSECEQTTNAGPHDAHASAGQIAETTRETADL